MFRIILICSVLLIKSCEMYRLETIISNYEKENGFIFDKATVLQKHYETINKNLPSPPSSSLLSNIPTMEYNPYLSDLVSTNIMQMALNIQTEIIKDAKIKQNVFSPVSIAGALSLLLLGSQGQTHQELSELFGFSDNRHPSSIPPTLLGNSKQLHDQFGLLIEDLLRNSPHSKRNRSVSKWKFQTNQDEEFLSIRHPKKLNNNDHKIEIANGLFIQKDVTLRNEYKTMVEKIYRGEIISVDYQNDAKNACKLINDWIKIKTNGRINEIISGLQQDTTMVITSALYFKAMWETSFIEAVTSKRNFYPNGNDNNQQKHQAPVLVDTMVNIGEFPYYESEEYDLRILGIPYKGNLTTMYIILPNNSNRQRLIQTQKLLSAPKIGELIENMEMKTMIVTLPKMHIQNSINLKSIFSNIGVKSLFNSQTNDLSLMLEEQKVILEKRSSTTNTPLLIFPRFDDGTENLNKGKQLLSKDKYLVRDKRAIVARNPIISGRFGKALKFPTPNLKKKRRIFVDDILHKVDLTISEKGTEGGATTASYLSRSDIELEFIINKPFLFVIRHDATKLPIFYGSIFQPI